MIVLMKGLNEERSVKRGIGDFHDEPWVDRIVVIDGGSVDYTVQECRQFPKVEVYVHPWLDWYHDMEITQSNIALSYVPHQQVALIVDFDERLSNPLKERLRKLRPEFVQFPVVHIARKTFQVLRHEDSPFAIYESDGWPVLSHEIGQFPDWQCRVIKRNPHLHWINSPHHVMDGAVGQERFEENEYIIHYEKDDARDRERIEKKWLRHQMRRRALGLTPDAFECEIKRELHDYATNNYWKD